MSSLVRSEVEQPFQHQGHLSLILKPQPLDLELRCKGSSPSSRPFFELNNTGLVSLSLYGSPSLSVQWTSLAYSEDKNEIGWVQLFTQNLAHGKHMLNFYFS